jgi:arylformamidase
MSDMQNISHDLEVAYDQAKSAVNMQEVLTRYRVSSDAARRAIGEPTRISYGSKDEEGLDLYRADEQHAPVVIFIHGGGWRGGTAKEYGFPAEMLLAAGIHFIALDFSSVLDTKGDLAVLVDQVRRAIALVWRTCTNFGGDAERLYVVGHSSGAHLAAMALSTHWAAYDLPENPIKGGVLISGIYDLGPLRQTSRSEYVHIDDRIEHQLSPIHHVASLTSPLLLFVGSKESPEFQRQAQDYAKAAAQAGKQIKVSLGEAYNHFEIAETLGNPYGFLGRRLLRFVNAHTAGDGRS